ncbi:MAG: hypothetical protein APF76_14085 [Desulfitibacter sp. BRH_c19]|nr:MAG: hypothetical protein APF76_14085 [Desulfitibacter sp. BRH_c19]
MLIVSMLFASGCGGGVQEANDDNDTGEEQLKMAFIMTGPATDGGWNTAHDKGRLGLQSELPNVETILLENVPDGGGDSERVMRQLIADGVKIIAATSYGYLETVEKLAKEFPDVYFLHCTGGTVSDNITAYDIREYQGTYLTGIVAGMMTESNIIGYAAAHPIPSVVRSINGFAMGVKAVNPDAKVKLLWTNTWYDPATEKEAGLSLADVGADILAQYQDSPAVQQAAAERGLYSIGYHSDMRPFAPDANLTSFMWNWAPFYIEEAKAYMEGTWKGHAYWGSMEEGAAEIAELNDKLVGEEVNDLVEQTKQKLISGELEVFAGPILNNEGVAVAEDGMKLTDEEMLSMNWLLDNIEGSL